MKVLNVKIVSSYNWYYLLNAVKGKVYLKKLEREVKKN